MCKTKVGTVAQMIWKDGKLNVKAFTLPCNKWDCAKCAKKKAIILGNRVKEGFKGERIRFATFTDSGKGSLGQRLQNLKSAWNRLRGELVRHYGLSKFFWVLEFGGKKGRPHLHALLNCYVPQSALSGLAKRCGFGSIVDIREVKDGGGFGYVFKYLSKDCGLKAGASALRAVRGRRFGVSRNIKAVKDDSKEVQTICFTQTAWSRDIKKDFICRCAKIIGDENKIVTVSDTLMNIEVQKPRPRYESAKTSATFAIEVPTAQHLQVLSDAAGFKSSWLWSENAADAIEAVGLTCEEMDGPAWECQKLSLLNPTLYKTALESLPA